MKYFKVQCDFFRFLYLTETCQTSNTYRNELQVWWTIRQALFSYSVSYPMYSVRMHFQVECTFSFLYFVSLISANRWKSRWRRQGSNLMAHVLLPCDLPNWITVKKYLNNVSNCKSIAELMPCMKKVYDLCRWTFSHSHYAYNI